MSVVTRDQLRRLPAYARLEENPLEDDPFQDDGRRYIRDPHDPGVPVYDPPEDKNTKQPVGPPVPHAPTAPAPAPSGGRPSAPPSRGATGQLAGYPDQLGRSMKHVFGAIASRYGNDRSLLPQILQDPEFQQWFPNARLIGDDKIDFGGMLSDFDSGVPVNVVDVSRGGDDVWQWIDQNFVEDGGGFSGGGSGPLAPLGNMPGGSDIMAALMGGDLGGGGDSAIWQLIQQELAKLLSGQPPSNPNVPPPLGGAR